MVVSVFVYVKSSQADAKKEAAELVEKVFGFGHPHKQTYIEYRESFDKNTLELVPDKMITWDLRKTYNLPMYTSRRL